MLSTYYDVEKILYVIIAFIGVPVNFVAIVILFRGKCGLSTCTTRYLVAMAAADLLVIIIDVICYRINRYLFPLNFLDFTPVCCSVNVLARTAKNCSVWFTVMFTFDRFVAICCQKLQTKYCTGKTAALVLPTIGVLLFLKNVPFYFAYNPKETIDNVPFFCQGKSSYYTHPGWIAFDTIHKIVTPLLPFTIILLLNTLTVRRILVANRARKGLRGQSNGGNRSDPEMESRKRSVILLFTLSGTFILLWLSHVAQFVYGQITRTAFVYTESERIFNMFGVFLSILNCCTNTFIYAVTQSRFRQQLKAALVCPVTALVQLMRKPTR